jgi:hypothetical protein
VKFWLGVFTTLLVVSPIPLTVTEYDVIVHRVEIQPERVDTPIADSLVDFDELDRQSLCLWEIMVAKEIEITLKSVLVMGDYYDMMGGACNFIGEHDD